MSDTGTVRKGGLAALAALLVPGCAGAEPLPPPTMDARQPAAIETATFGLG